MRCAPWGSDRVGRPTHLLPHPAQQTAYLGRRNLLKVSNRHVIGNDPQNHMTDCVIHPPNCCKSLLVGATAIDLGDGLKLQLGVGVLSVCCLDAIRETPSQLPKGNGAVPGLASELCGIEERTGHRFKCFSEWRGRANGSAQRVLAGVNPRSGTLGLSGTIDLCEAGFDPDPNSPPVREPLPTVGLRDDQAAILRRRGSPGCSCTPCACGPGGSHRRVRSRLAGSVGSNRAVGRFRGGRDDRPRSARQQPPASGR